MHLTGLYRGVNIEDIKRLAIHYDVIFGLTLEVNIENIRIKPRIIKEKKIKAIDIFLILLNEQK